MIFLIKLVYRTRVHHNDIIKTSTCKFIQTMERTFTVLTETDIVALFTVMSQRNYNSSVPVSLGHPFEISCGSHGRAGRQRRSVQRHSWVWAGHISKSGRLVVSAFIGNPVTRAGKGFSRLIYTLTPTHSLRRHM